MTETFQSSGWPFYTKRNRRLTAYSFSCGYVEQKSTDHDAFKTADLYTEMYREHGVYHVRQYDRRPNAPVFRVFWETFSNVRQARNLFNRQLGGLFREVKV